ncbi:MAG: GNAT family protein [Candidatus Liptonbacteria bacterium]|nr:GNAT family protein [Candidatus Liptonbacteria bacterium]
MAKITNMKPGTLIYRGITRKDTPIVIRYPKLSDAQAFLKYINALSRERTFILNQGYKFTLKEEKRWLKELMEKTQKKQAVFLSVFSGEELIGSASVVQKNKAMSHEGSFGIAIAKNFRGESIGTLLMKLTIKEARRNLKGLKILTLSIFANNPIAMKLYKKSGFKKYGSLPKGIFHRGKYINHHYLYKRIR